MFNLKLKSVLSLPGISKLGHNIYSLSLWNCVLIPLALDVEWIFKSDTTLPKHLFEKDVEPSTTDKITFLIIGSLGFVLFSQSFWSKVLFAESSVLCAKSFVSAKLFDKTTITLSWKCNTFGPKQYYFVSGMKVEYFYCRCKLASRPTLWITLCIFTKL